MNREASTSSDPQPGPSKCRRGTVTKRGWRPYRRNWNPGPPKEKPTVLSISRLPSSSSSTNSSITSVVPADLPLLSVTLDETPGDYIGWKLYFPKEEYDPSSATVRKVKSIENHFKLYTSLYNFPIIKNQYWFTLSLQTLSEDIQFKEKWPTFHQDLSERPEHTLSCAGVAMHKLVSSVLESELSFSQQATGNCSVNNSLQSIRARIHGYGPVVTLRSLKVNNYDRLLAIRGTVIRAAAAEILCTWMAFRCPACGSEQAIKQPEGVMTVPTSCKAGCRARSNFIPLLSSPYTRTEAFQSIRLQESMLGEQYDSGRVPRSIEVELTEDLVDSVCPGDDVTLAGILKVRPQEELQRKGQASMYKMYIRAVAVSSNKNTMSNRKSEFTEKDMQAIKLISKEPSTFKLLVQSLCPAIYGHEMVKAGLILGLFGGSGGGNNSGRRTEIHVLVVGDPGVGKSQMLQASSNVSPRGVFVCGNSSSSAGLTVTVRHEKGCVGGGGSLEAGALVLADQGACCIDEFDKMSSNHNALLEVMEQQTVSVAKAGVLCSLPARTSILAAANPSGGHYNRSKTVSENLKMNPALLSRFDLVFILLDRPDKHLDSLLTAHIQALHAGTKKLPTGNSFVGMKEKENVPINNSEPDEKPLAERLKLEPGEDMDLLPQVLMQKYIAYARKSVHPRLTHEAATEIKKFYLELRKVRTGVDAIPVTTRQLEGLIRLTQARARLDLASDASLQHALDVLSVIRYSLVDVFSTDDGALQMQRNINGSGMSQASQIKKFIRVLQMRSNTLDKTIFSTDELKDIASNAGLTASLNQILDSLNIQGFLLKKGRNLYKVLLE